MPPVRILDNMQLEPNDYKIRIKEIEVGDGAIYPSLLMVMDPEGQQISLPGEHTTEPASACRHLDRPVLARRGRNPCYSIIESLDGDLDPSDRSPQGHVADLLSYSGVQSLLKNLTSEQQNWSRTSCPR